MAKYQRFVYYIYNYEMGEKRGNVGFLRVENRNGSCKMTIQLRALSQTEPLKIYLFRRGRGNMVCHEAGSLSMKNGMGSTVLLFSLQELAEMGFPFEEIAGMLLFSNREKFYATTWDDGGILIDEMVFPDKGEKADASEKRDTSEKDATAEKVGASETTGTAEKAGTSEKVGTPEKIDTPENAGAPEKVGTPEKTEGISFPDSGGQANNDGNRSESVSQLPVREETQGSATNPPVSGDNQIPSPHPPVSGTGQSPSSPLSSAGDMNTQSSISRDETPKAEEKIYTQSPTLSGAGKHADLEAMAIEEAPLKEITDSCALKILSNYPKMYPFESDDVLDSVRIELQDLHELPIEYWALAHNSFLLQGYYSYLHLLFAQMKNENKELCYVIGVPGICHVKQNYLASRFGFGRFIPLRQTEDINGEFGYWILVCSTAAN